jgi:hypothetical protein
MSPEDHCGPTAVDVWVVLSLLSQLIVVPAGIVSGFAPNAAVVCADAPLEMVTVVLPAGAGVGVPDGADGALYPPHAARPIDKLRMVVMRRDMFSKSSCEIGGARFASCRTSTFAVIVGVRQIFRAASGLHRNSKSIIWSRLAAHARYYSASLTDGAFRFAPFTPGFSC